MGKSETTLYPTMIFEDFSYMGSIEVSYIHFPEASAPGWGCIEPERVEILNVCLVLGDKRAHIRDVLRKEVLEKIEEEILENI